jgi:hypothetical protein
MADTSIRPLAIMLAAQLVVVAALLLWASQGFPLPSALTGAGKRATTPATSASAPGAVGAAGGAPPANGQAGGAPGRLAEVADPARALAPRPTQQRFPSGPAFALLREQVERYGWRPAGSESLRRLAVRLRGLLPDGRFEPIPAHPGLRNVVGSLPGRGKAIVLGAHYDVEAHPKGFVGANDGAAGTAAVVYLARALAREPRRVSDRPLQFVLFDGEEDAGGCRLFLECALRGSKAYAARHADETQGLVLLDYIAEKHGLSFPREGGSDPALWEQLRSAASDAGVGELFTDAQGVAILDDHTPFAHRGIQAIDVIDFAYPPADTLADTLDKVSRRSLDAVGEAVYLLVSRLRREP